MKGRRRKEWIWDALAGMDCGYEKRGMAWPEAVNRHAGRDEADARYVSESE